MIKSAYIHIPFCNSFCSYCDFCKLKADDKKQTQYLLFLEKEIKHNYAGEILETIYIGGGTPSVLSTVQLQKLKNIISLFNKSADCEITMEINCESITFEKLKLLHQFVNRLSFGVQTFNDHLLAKLGRKHTAAQASQKINLAKKVGFENISIDLMYGIYDSSLRDVKNDIIMFKKLAVPHVSFYALMVKDNSKKIIGEPVSEETELQMYEYICNNLSEYSHYEISNFAKKGWQAKHNLTYWHNEEYYGFGMGATGYVAKKRYQNANNWHDYIQGKRQEKEVKKKEQIENEFILGLRLLDGICEEKFLKKYGMSFSDFPVLMDMVATNRLQLVNGCLKINENNLYIMNEILVDLWEDLWKK